ncbi:tyrosine-protein phosphatase non-receptor type substrate 1-like isoform X2 [Sapajus apella]|uniref:Tyrosine-protein phosphatase non-receptor type substrate 1-like isoform X2 n=1 Tax=Sapajus apella TaxID=9515 RepID=A0A6J3JBJ4_SAPAP|nr:tyrosine-protein phosphatase non-receptor type substrate 1-like isoform X2 [Sapajus apella]
MGWADQLGSISPAPEAGQWLLGSFRAVSSGCHQEQTGSTVSECLTMATIPAWALGSLLPTLLLGFTAGQPFISLTGPSQRTTPGDSVPFNCTAGPFNSQHFSQDVNVTWWKDSDEHPASAQRLVPGNEGNDFITSKAWVTLARQDVSSEITCKVTHRALAQPLQTTMKLSQVLRVVPTLKITTEHSGTSVRAQHRVNLTCHVRHFYPRHLQLTWMQNRRMIQTLVSPQATRNPDGTYSLEHTWQAEVTPDEHEFACWVVHDEQPPLKTNITLQAQEHRQGKGRHAQPQPHKLQGPLQRSEPGTRIRLTYTSSGFSTNQVTVTWLKNKHKLPKPQTSIRRSGRTYNVTSSVLVPLTEDDVLSHVVCYVEHKLMPFFQKTIDLDQYLRVPPAVTVSQSSTSSSLVAVTCLVQRFYPQNVHLTWLEDCHTLKDTEQPTSKKNDDGSYTVENVLLVNASVQGLERVLTCMVEHEGQLPKRANLILSTTAHTTCKLIGSTGPEMPAVIFVVFLLGLKVLLVMSFTVTYICRRWNL